MTRPLRPFLYLLVLMAVLGTAVVAPAQEERPRSDTGRRKPEPLPPPEKPRDEDLRQRPIGPPGDWYVGLGGGLKGGGDLWHVETLNQAPVPWESRVPFTSERFNASLDNDASFGVFVGRHLDDRWSLRADLGSARIDVAAEALQGQQGAVFLYDRITVTSFSVSAEVRLVRLPSYPYLHAGPVLNLVSSAGWDALDQTSVGWRVGGGYLRQMGPEYSLRAEVRYGRMGFDPGDFQPETAMGGVPGIEFEVEDQVGLFEIVLAVQMNL